MSRCLLLLLAAAAFAVAPLSAAPSTGASGRRLDLQLLDQVRTIQCPSGAAPAQCYLLSSSARTVAVGLVQVGPFTDVEVDRSDPRCHQPITAKDRLTFSGGSVDVDITGPQLCYGLVETVPRTFTVTGGTGIFAGATGQGEAPMSLLASGASEHWQGQIQAPNLPLVADPAVKMKSLRTARRSKTERFTVVFSARARGWPSSIRYTVAVRSGTNVRRRRGSLASSVTAHVSLTLPRAHSATLTLQVIGSGGQVTLRRRLHER